MRGLMMDRPLRLGHFLERAEKLYPRREIVSRTAQGLHRTNYGELGRRVRRLASALARLGLDPGDRVGSFAWNHYRHLELYFAVPTSRRVLHTLNVRLFPEQIAFIANHAQDRVIFVDDVLVPLLEKVAPELRHVKAYVVMGDGAAPATSLAPLVRYEELIASGTDDYELPTFDENEAAAMCYTSGTTGNPKGVLYSHRALFLQSMAHAMADGFGLSEARFGPGDRADVPRQRMVHAVRVHDGRCQAGLPGAISPTLRPSRALGARGGHSLRRCADDSGRESSTTSIESRATSRACKGCSAAVRRFRSG